ncbi:unnamed protein product [Lampetra planeri]
MELYIFSEARKHRKRGLSESRGRDGNPRTVDQSSVTATQPVGTMRQRLEKPSSAPSRRVTLASTVATHLHLVSPCACQHE